MLWNGTTEWSFCKMSNRSPSLEKELSERDRVCFRCVLEACDEDDPRCLWREVSEKQRLILFALYDSSMVCSLIAEKTCGHKRRTVLNNLYALKKRGYVVNDGAKIPVWSLTKEGEAYVDRKRQAGERSETRGV